MEAVPVTALYVEEMMSVLRDTLRTKFQASRAGDAQLLDRNNLMAE